MLRYRGILRYGISNTVNAEKKLQVIAAIYHRYVIVVIIIIKCRNEKKLSFCK